MTAIRPRPPPGQERREERREETLAQAKATQILLSQSRFPFVLAVFYIALLIVPWVLTCRIASQPSWIIHVWRWDTRYDIRYGWLIAIKVLNSLATVLSLPILSALLARAAVVFSQRRKPGQTLSLRQLFALADRDWYNFFRVLSPVASSAFLRLGFLVLFIAALLPLIRSGLVAYDNVLVTDNLPRSYASFNREMLGYTPSPLALKSGYEAYQDEVLAETRKSLLTTVGGIEPKLWPVCNDESSDSTCGFKYGPYDLGQSSLSKFWEWPDSYGSDRDFKTNGSALMFASTFWAGSSIGSYYENDFGAYTLGLKSGARCETISSQELEEHCLRSLEDWSLPNAARGWNTSMEIDELRVDICYPALERSPWEAADASPWKPINFTEHLYIGISDEDSFWGCPSWADDCEYAGSDEGLFVHCQADSAMSFFEIGSAKTKGVPTRLLDEMPSGFDIPRRQDRLSAPNTSPEDVGPDFIGPLKTAALAMFGNGSWLHTLNLVYPGVKADNTTLVGALTGVCQMLPLGNIDVFGRGEHCEEIEYVGRNPGWHSPPQVFSALTRDFFQSFYTPKLARATLNTATFYANQALLSQMAGPVGFDSRDYKRGTETRSEMMTVPVLSVPAIAIVSILIAMQVVCIIIILAYIYSSRVWTRTLDALAMARVGAQLSALDAFLVPRETGTLGTARLSPRAAKQLEQTDGLVGSTALTGHHHDVEMATVPPPYAPRGEEPSTREEQSVPRPGPAAAARDTAPQQDHPPVPSYSPPAGEHTTRAADGPVDSAAAGRGDASDMDISHAAPGESQGAVLPAVTSIDAVAVGGRGLITKRMWRQADKPLPAPPAEQ